MQCEKLTDFFIRYPDMRDEDEQGDFYNDQG
jgi:hypothetical protein